MTDTKKQPEVNTTCRILVGLDEILDTRLGTLCAINADFGTAISMDKNYYTRTIDKFSTPDHGTLSVANFLAFFKANRDLILRNSIVTKIPRLIDIHVTNILSKMNDNPMWTSVEIHLNVSPYKLEKAELDNILKLFRSLISCPISITLIDKPLEELTPEYIDDAYPIVYMYRYYELLEVHRNAFKKKHCSNVMIYAPAVNFLDNISPEVAEILQKEKTDIYEWTAKLISPYVNIQFAPIGVYSATLPLNKT
jgi:hypothetical protein